MIVSVKKVIYAIFFTTKGLAIQVPVSKRKSMNARFYTTPKRKTVLKKLVRFFQERRKNPEVFWKCDVVSLLKD